MARSSSANIIVDPDGDLVLLLNPNYTKSDWASPADPKAINTRNDGISTRLQTIRALERGSSEVSQDRPTLIYSDRILVSSKHMSLASPIFKAMLQGGFQEATTLKETGMVEVPLPDDDPTAMKIFIYIIHSRFNCIPSRIILELFTQLAILVDKYNSAEVIGPYPKIWRKTMQNWTNSSSDLARWLCIAWQFGLDEEFLRATKLIQLQSTCDLETTMARMRYNLPIPKQVIDKMELCRLNGVKKAVKILEDLIKMYQHPAIRCTATEIPQVEIEDKYDPYRYYVSDKKKISILNYDKLFSYRQDCDSMLLGSLTKSAIQNGLFPLPAPPYTSWSMKYLLDRMELLEASSLCSKLLQTSAVQHGVIDGLKKSIRDIDKSGLCLAECL